MNDESNKLLVKIETAIQNIQDETIPRPQLGNFDMRNSHLYWELGVLVKQFINSYKVSDEKIIDFIDTKLREIEKKIRHAGKRKGKESFDSWFTENKQTKKIKPPEELWVQLCWEFVDQYQDEERWNLVAELSGNKFQDKEGNTLFTRKFAEDLLPYFSKKEPIQNAEELQLRFIKEISRFEKKPHRESEWEPIISEIFGKPKIELMNAIINFDSIKSEVNEAIEEKSGTAKHRSDLLESIQINELELLRKLLRLISITDENKFQKRVKDLGKLPSTIKTKHVAAKDLYKILFFLIKDMDSRHKFLHRRSSYDLSMLNTKLKAISGEEYYQEYLEAQKLRQELFS